jgi:hypothetical protein
MKLATLALAFGLASPAFASSPAINVDFETTWGYGQSIDNFYAAQGVSFVNVLGLSNGDGLGPLASGDYYAGAPSPLGVAFAQLDGITNTAAYMNVAGGVDGQLNFYFSNPTGSSVEIKAYSGLNGTGNLLGTVVLGTNGVDYTSWTATSLTFSGTALSFDLTATAAGVALDNISAVPEPSSLALMLGGATLLLARRRRG